MYKKCPRCRKSLPATKEYFYKGRGVGGTHGWCKECSRAYGKTWTAENSGKRKATKKRWNEAHKDHNAEIHKTWRANNLTGVAAATLRRGVMTRAKKRHIAVPREFHSTKFVEELLIAQQDCPCCGVIFDLSLPGKKGPKNHSPTVDRLDPTNPNYEGNWVLLCWLCNTIKSRGTSAQHRRIADWMDGAIAA